MSKLSRAQAAALIADVRADNGGISREDREATPPAVLRALASVRRKLAGATKILVNNLYSKDTRFIYELIQNAEDNSYTQATAANENPFLIFRLYTDKIIIDSNEDGFDESNVKAICSTGESTKTDSDGYIGEKGIGFKSVFKVATKVHVQSGPFSFSFEHMRSAEDDGLGMVTPMNEDFKEIPSGIRTRMTLTLLGNVQFEHLLKDFRGIPDTLLLFLRKLQGLTIEIHQPGEAVTSVTYSKHDRHENGLNTTNLAKVTQDNTKTSTSDQKFYIVKREVRDLPYDAARVDKKQKSIDHARIILAFPVDKDDVPVLEKQHVFAFLPLRRAGFKFLIQSDFVTQANREDVVHTPRNEAILAGVAETFRDAALQFCNHSSLCYQWMRYLPSDSISDDFWGSLWTRVCAALLKTKILKPWSEKGLYCPPQLRRLPSDYYDKFGEPLLPDLKDEIYLSRRYLVEDSQILYRLGTTLLSWRDIISRLRADLESSSSRWKSMSSEDDWRTKMCTLLSKLATNKDIDVTIRVELKNMELVPTQDGKWVSPGRLTVYFPDTKGVPIPTDLGLGLVHTAATKNPSWQSLLSKIGVAGCPVEMVIKAISQRYSGGVKRSNEANISLGSSIAHLRYLYEYLPEKTLVLDPNIWIFNHETQPVPSDEYLYFNDPEDKENLSGLFGRRQDGDVDLPGYSVNFLHPNYIHAVNGSANRNGISWISWLESVAGVRHNPQICAKGSRKVSGEFRYIINYRSERLLWILKRYWSIYEDQIQYVRATLLGGQVRLEPGYGEALRETFLPFPKLKHLVEEYCVPNFPFICMSPQLRDEEIKEWRFLEGLHVGIDDTIDFYIRALSEIMLANENGCDPITESAVFRLYHKIQKQCNEDLEAVTQYFNSESALYIPADKGTSAVWTTAELCVWEGPEWLRSKRRLGIAPYRGLETLFKSILKIPDASLNDFLQDLFEMKEEKRGNAAEARIIYDYLWHVLQSSHSEEPREELRESFDNHELVYVPHLDAWFSPLDCVWAKPHVEIPGKASVAGDFNSQKLFFTDALMVPEPTANMHIAALMSQAKGQPAASKVKETMMLISSLGVTAKDVAKLQGIKIFPVRLPGNQSCFAAAAPGSGSIEFAIIDNLIYRKAFHGRIASLDFSLEELRDAREFLVACGLNTQYTFTLVKEVIDVHGASPDKEMTEMLRSKASAIVRCANHYATADQRQEPNSLYRLLKGVSVVVSGNIIRSMRIRLDGEVIEAERHKAEFHLEKKERGLFLYLPKDEADRIVCIEYELPRKLREFLNITDPGAESVLGAVFRQHGPAIIERILEKAGVTHVSISDYTELEEQITRMQPDGERPDGQPVDEIPGPQQEEELASEQQDTEYRNFAWSQMQTTPSPRPRNSPASAAPNQALNLLMPTSGQFRPSVNEDQSVSYKKILENVITIARRRAAGNMFSGVGSCDNIFSMLDSLSSEVVKQGFGSRSIDRDRRVGAAGELYVFEYLQNLQLPGFGMSNWKSVIRDYVSAHENYSDIEQWKGNSIADVEYDDVEGQFTAFLIRKGHLARDVWINERPYYYFEVKTTTSHEWYEPFFMSRAQFSHLQDMRIEQGKIAPKIYVIIRIYGVGKGDATGLSVYIDPETLRQKGKLDFQTETWAVTPKSPQIRRPGQSENDSLPPDTLLNRTTTAANQERKSPSPGNGTNFAQSPTPPVVPPLGETSELVVRKETVNDRPASPEGATSSSNRDNVASLGLFASSSAGPKAAASAQLPIRGAKSAAEEHTNSRTSPPLSPESSSTPSGNTASSSISPPLFTPKSEPRAVDPSAKPTGGLFASNQPTGSLFGQTSSSSTPGLFNGGNPFKAPKSTPEVGNSAQQNSISTQDSLPTGSSLFSTANTSSTLGSTANTPSGFGNPANSTSGSGSTARAPSLFGNTANSTSGFGSTARSPSFFGNNINSSSGFGSTASTPSLSGNTTNTPSAFGNPANTSSVFGSTARFPSLFGNTTNTSSAFGNPANTTSSFGNSTAAGSGLFASTGSGLFGGPTQGPFSTGSPNIFGPFGQSSSSTSTGSSNIFGGNSSFNSGAATGSTNNNLDFKDFFNAAAASGSSFGDLLNGSGTSGISTNKNDRGLGSGFPYSTSGAGSPPFATESDATSTMHYNYQSITMAPLWKHHSFEEVRLRDYELGYRFFRQPSHSPAECKTQ